MSILMQTKRQNKDASLPCSKARTDIKLRMKSKNVSVFDFQRLPNIVARNTVETSMIIQAPILFDC